MIQEVRRLPRVCTVCSHPMREHIEEALIRSEPLRNIAEQYGISVTALHRHKGSHLPELLLRAREEEESDLAVSVYEQVEQLQRRTLAILERAEREGDLRTALLAVKELRGILALVHRMGSFEEIEIVDDE